MECLIRSWKIEDATDFAAALNIQTLFGYLRSLSPTISRHAVFLRRQVLLARVLSEIMHIHQRTLSYCLMH